MSRFWKFLNSRPWMEGPQGPHGPELLAKENRDLMADPEVSDRLKNIMAAYVVGEDPEVAYLDLYAACQAARKEMHLKLALDMGSGKDPVPVEDDPDAPST